MFRDFIFLKNDLDIIYSENKLKGKIYRKKYLYKIQKLINNLKDHPVDVNLIRGFYEFLKLTRINLDEKYKEVYNVSLYSDKNSIHIIVDNDISFTITLFMENNIIIKYHNGKKGFEYEIKDDFSIDDRDQVKYKIINTINDKFIDIIIFSIMSYFKKGK